MRNSGTTSGANRDRFEVLTDNNPLCHLKTAKLGATEQKWVAQLSVFDFEVKYQVKCSNVATDTLSRQGFAGEPLTSMDDEFDDCICKLINRRTVLDTDLIAAGIECRKVRQVGAMVTGTAKRQGSTPSLPRYTMEQFWGF